MKAARMQRYKKYNPIKNNTKVLDNTGDRWYTTYKYKNYKTLEV